MTYSIIVLGEKRDLLGIGVVSGSIAVGSRVPWAKYRVGGVATQAYTNPSLGPIILNYIEQGLDPGEALKRALAEDGGREERQVAVLDWKGNGAVFEGKRVPNQHNSYIGENCVSIANLVSNPEIPKEMCETIRRRLGVEIGSVITEALETGHSLGGDRRGDRSAALIVVGKTEYGALYDKILDIRVDYSENDPVSDLMKIYNTFIS